LQPRRAVLFHRQGEIRDRTFENQSFRASGLSLISGHRVLEHPSISTAPYGSFARRVSPFLMISWRMSPHSAGLSTHLDVLDYRGDGVCTIGGPRRAAVRHQFSEGPEKARSASND
jgi:hypothetical protein